jgi:hypothetical protein
MCGRLALEVEKDRHMKKRLLATGIVLAVAAIVFFLVIPKLNTLTSSTTIEAGRTFEVGEKEHGAFSVEVLNTCKQPISVSRATIQGEETQLAVLASGKSKTFSIPQDTKAMFANRSNITCIIELTLTGDTNLSMGGKNY